MICPPHNEVKKCRRVIMSEKSLFSGGRYATRGVMSGLCPGLQFYLWNLIDRMEIEKDYLQVFVIESFGRDWLKVIHRQEVPHYEKEHLIKVDGENKDGKIFVIDSVDYSTMLYAEEY